MDDQPLQNKSLVGEEDSHSQQLKPKLNAYFYDYIK